MFYLKDRDLHKALDSISDGQFTIALNNAHNATEEGYCVGEGDDVISVHFGKFSSEYVKGKKFSIKIHLNEIEELLDDTP